ncbi:MAG: Blue (Type 1) copper domain-containing protein [Candidatus Amesbacteria bacterium GW2011_GWA2_47_11]|uniref:Blue (Type 1) copper domain protein n=2 Tax=Candidatus Amesiibacteriota TaxID=1752730 RepID=A0A0G1XE07_9BACT|nr:MAG: Blue (Type 1) copper domain-containing protein [Candidatus Amesbacteria bacterium GW2011_GWA2_47_11]KKU92575.1 MAG: Blue (Type 1) copper domain protein [Candidatus Amesbacteria bacterium GW2011_GWC1_48_10]OGC97673.1 MAG: hypothetical protein A2W16_01325 [Candidatus Amesbacteria bacterium RBG_16_48_31]
MEEETAIQKQERGSFNPLIIVAVVVVIGIAIAGLTMVKKGGQVEGTQIAVEESVNTQEVPMSDTSEVKVVNIEGGAFYFKPNEIRAKAGETVKIVFTNAGGIHDFVIDELSVQSTKINDGETTEVVFTPQTPGTFEFYCSVGNHRAMGMKGTLIVE